MLSRFLGLVAACGLAAVIACSPNGSAPEVDAGASTADVGSSGDEVAEGELSGQVAGRLFRLDEASLTDGILELRQGEDIFAELSVTIFLSLGDESPEGKTWTVKVDDSAFGGPHIHVSSMGDDGGVPDVEMFMNEYQLDLEFGKFEKFEIPGQIRLRIAGDEPTELNGRFVAVRDGLELRAGEVDRQSDDLSNLRWIAEHWIAERWLEVEMGSQTEIVNHHQSWMTHPDPEGRVQTGWIEFEVRAAPDAESRDARLLMVKTDDGWAVHERYDATALRPAHPFDEPATDEPFEYLGFVAARDLETRHSGQPIYHARFNTSHGSEDGKVEVTYRLGERDAEATKATYRFELGSDGAWQLIGRDASDGE